ncbi:MAG: LacI family transcriptional regulator [Treponema sp.]|jgi:LacI family transcriptional regulator|nr:LacI family transcriptional regulator [Treponema sp.]
MTMIDIAKAAGVSLTTVGRVVRKKGYVSREKREAVEEVIRKTGYVPNLVAQGLKSSRTGLIGHLTVLNPNMLYEQISKSINRAAAQRGYQVLTYAADLEDQNTADLLDELIGRRVDGIAITSNPQLDQTLLQKILVQNIPLVMVERTLNVKRTDRIVVSDYRGAYTAVQHIIRHGHRKIAFIGKFADQDVENRRLNGYKAALRAAGIAEDKTLIELRRNYGVEEGSAAAERLLELPSRPTAVFMTSDLFACGFLQACYRRKIRVPDDISLVGYDNTLSMMLSPPITSVSLGLDDLGSDVMELLLSRMNDGLIEGRQVANSTSLIDRGSVRLL